MPDLGSTGNGRAPGRIHMANKSETIAGALVVGIGVALLIHANKLAYMIENVPGPGFLPLWLGIGIVATGVVLTGKALRPAAAAIAAIDWPPRSGWVRICVMLGALAVALLILEPLGFLLTAMLFMAALVFSLGVRSWPTLLGVPIVSALVLHLVFVVWLGVPLPMGILSLFE
jgi:putative tricarboxylic transport membrane protein